MTISTSLVRSPHTAEQRALALVSDIHSVLGFRPEQSIALRIRRRRKPFAVLRIDLPDPPGPAGADAARLGARAGESPQSAARVITGLVSRVSGAVAVEVVVFLRAAEHSRSVPPDQADLVSGAHGERRLHQGEAAADLDGQVAGRKHLSMMRDRRWYCEPDLQSRCGTTPPLRFARGPHRCAG